MPLVAFAFGSFGDILSTAGIVIKVINVLYDSRDASSSRRDLMLELRSLHRTLLLINDSVQRHSNTTLGSSLVCSVEQEVKECHAVMHAFLESIQKYQEPLNSTGIRAMWGKVRWSLWEPGEISALQHTLSSRTQRLTMLLTALSSISVDSLGDDVRRGNNMINAVATAIRRTQSPLRTNPENTVWVVDVQYLTAKLEADATNPLDWYELGRTYMAGHSFSRAYEAYQQAIYRDGRNPKLWTAVGVLYHQLNQPADAVDAHSRAIQIDPYLSETWYHLGQVYESCDIHSDALDAYNRGHDLDPTNNMVAQRLIVLLRSHPGVSDSRQRYPISRPQPPFYKRDRANSTVDGGGHIEIVDEHDVEADKKDSQGTTNDDQGHREGRAPGPEQEQALHGPTLRKINSSLHIPHTML